MALHKEAAYAYRVMVEAERAWAASFREAEVYELGPPKDHFGELLPCRRKIILARTPDIPDMTNMQRAREYYAATMCVIEGGKMRTSGPGSRSLSPVMRFDPGAPGNRAPLDQDDDVMRHPIKAAVHTETDAYRGGPISIDQLLKMMDGDNPSTTIQIDGVTHWLRRDENGRAMGPDELIFRERSGVSHRLSLLDASGHRRQVRVANILVAGAAPDVMVTAMPPRARRSKYEIDYREVGQVTIGPEGERVLTAYMPR